MTGYDELSDTQREAANRLAEGVPETDLVDALDVDAETLASWVDEHPYFQAAVNRRREAIRRESVDRLRNLLPRLVDALEESLEDGELSPKHIMGLLKLVDLDSLHDVGSIDGKRIFEKQAEARDNGILLQSELHERDRLNDELERKFG